jgi:hypothetical protein
MFQLARNFSVIGGILYLLGTFALILLWRPDPEYLTMLLYAIPQAIMALGVIFIMYAAVFWWQFISRAK